MFPSRSLYSFITLALLVKGAIGAIGPVADLVLTNAVVSPDGFERSAALAGGGVVGDLITGNIGDTFQLNVVNNLVDDTMLVDTSIHWHGFFQKGSSWADGPAFVTQCPIVSGDSFLYTFSVPDQAGTFWYHSHLSTQYCDGIRGPFVVYDPNDPHGSLYDVDDESTVWTLADWYHDPAPTLVIGVPDANLFNGLGRSASGTATELGVATVTSGTRYRIRLVNIACDPDYVFSIDGHTMTIIEVDGVSHEPLEVDSIQIYAGQRYSFILEANQPVDNYWVRFNPSVGDLGFAGGINSGILRYEGAPEEEPSTEFTDPVIPLFEGDLVPLGSLGFTVPGTPGVGNADININLDMQFTGAGFTVNGATWTSPTVPVLLQILSGAQTPGDLLPNDSIYELEANRSVEITMPGGVIGGGHPLHLHGHTFDVVRVAGSEEYNYVNPVRRDVVNIGTTGDQVTIRFFTDNPGPWFLHCHIDWHIELGFAITFAERTDEWVASNPVPAAWDQLCPIYEEEGTSSD